MNLVFWLNIDIDNIENCMFGDCNLCQYFSSFFISSYIPLIKYNITKRNFLKSYYKNLFLRNSEITRKFLNNKNIKFSWYLCKSEGPCRIRNKLKAKIDIISKDEICKHYYTDTDISEIIINQTDTLTEFGKIVNCIKTNHLMEDILNLSKIFNIQIVNYLVDFDDKFEEAYNCLFIRNLYQEECIFIIGTKRIYIYKYLKILRNTVYLAKTKYNKSFWILNKYEEENEKRASQHSQISNSSDFRRKSNKITEELKILKYKRDKQDVRRVRLNYQKINEIHKRRYLLSHNSLEIFMKNGSSFFITFNQDKRDFIFEKVLSKIK